MVRVVPEPPTVQFRESGGARMASEKLLRALSSLRENDTRCRCPLVTPSPKRRLVKAMVDVSVKHDGTVRNSLDEVIQFADGEDC